MQPQVNYIYNKKDIFHIFAYVPAGSIYEKDDTRGISHVLEHMLYKHTKDFTENQLLREITTIGGSYNAVTDRDVTFFYIMTHCDNYKKAVDIVHSILTAPVFLKKELELEKKVVLEEVHRRMDDNADLENLLNMSILSDKNKYAYPVEGYPDTIKAITVNHLENYFNERYKQYMLVVNCFDKKKTEIQEYIDKKFGSHYLCGFDKATHLYDPFEFRSSINVLRRRYQQYTTCISFPSFPRSYIKENIICNFLRYCLASSGLYSILSYELRTKRGLIYTVSALNEVYRYIGMFRIEVATTDANTYLILSIIFDVLQKIKNKGIPKKTLQSFKKSFLNVQKYAVTNEEFRTMWHGESLFYNCDISDAEYINIVKQISNEDIIEITRKLFDFSRIGLLTYGNYRNINTYTKELTDLISTFILM